MKLGIIGAGMIVKDFLTITPSLKDLELTAISGRQNDEEIMNQFKKEFRKIQLQGWHFSYCILPISYSSLLCNGGFV